MVRVVVVVMMVMAIFIMIVVLVMVILMVVMVLMIVMMVIVVILVLAVGIRRSVDQLPPASVSSSHGRRSRTRQTLPGGRDRGGRLCTAWRSGHDWRSLASCPCFIPRDCQAEDSHCLGGVRL